MLFIHFHTPPPSTPKWQTNSHAKVIDIIQQGEDLRVRYQASFWHARPTHPDIKFKPNEKVSVLGREGLKLIIGPITA